ncbi:hypothetical protein RUM43_007758 [Polyplax serrata]|uniref:Ribosomal protein S18 n=1 Tax=Polyplax serrata TaxID=468196 RepID=A0AAN8P961_POLSC
MLKTVLKITAARTFDLRALHTTPVFRVRQIIVNKKDDKTTVIEGKYIPSPRTPFLLKFDSNSNKCYLCQLQLNIKHTDVLILSQFVNSKGYVFKKSELGICEEQYKLIKNLIYMAQYAGLLPQPPLGRPKKPYEELNTYYDEETINVRKRKAIISNKLKFLKLGPIESLRVKPERGVAG